MVVFHHTSQEAASLILHLRTQGGRNMVVELVFHIELATVAVTNHLAIQAGAMG